MTSDTQNPIPETRLWPTVEVSVDPQSAETISTGLWEAGVLGIETVAETAETVHLRAYFQDEISPEGLEHTLREFLRQFGESPSALRSLRTYGTADEDWLENWKKGYTCFTVGSRWLIVPSWKREEALANADFADRLWIEIDPGMAFGTGTHETTQLCLTLLETLPGDVNQVLDVGTGTGILAFAAAKLFPQAAISACDTDAEALMIASENLEQNHLTTRISLQVGSVTDYPPQTFDVTLANLTADVIIPLAEALVNSVRDGGHLVLSGILDTQIEDVQQAIERAGGSEAEVLAAGEWRALLVKAKGKRQK